MTKISQTEVRTLIRKLRRRYTYPHMERVLELKSGSFKKWWKGEGVHSGELALLRTLATIPWAIDVADEKFNKQYAELRLVQAAIERKR